MSQVRRFTGQTALVTGAGHGIGPAVALRFGAEKARVVVNDVDQASAEAVGREITTLGGEAVGLVADVSSKPQVDAMFDAAFERFGPIDVLVNNAGLITMARHFLEADEVWWDSAAQVMARRRSGVIIHMSSGGATRAHRGNVAYDASNGGMEAMTRAMALDLAPYGVRVNAVVPGLIRTYEISDEVAAEGGQVVPQGRLGDPEDIAGPTVFLATDDARYVTGATFAVDGGLLVQQRSGPVDTFPVSHFPVMDGER